EAQDRANASPARTRPHRVETRERTPPRRSPRLPGAWRRIVDGLEIPQLATSHYQPIAASAGLDSARPYDLRHSFASLLFAQGTNPAEVAEQMGHTLQTLLSTYIHVIEELRGAERKPAEDLIPPARAK